VLARDRAWRHPRHRRASRSREHDPTTASRSFHTVQSHGRSTRLGVGRELPKCYCPSAICRQASASRLCTDDTEERTRPCLVRKRGGCGAYAPRPQGTVAQCPRDLSKTTLAERAKGAPCPGPNARAGHWPAGRTSAACSTMVVRIRKQEDRIRDRTTDAEYAPRGRMPLRSEIGRTPSGQIVPTSCLEPSCPYRASEARSP
jgi:hypothetical protein